MKSGVLMKDLHQRVSFTSTLALRFYFNEIITRFTDNSNGSIHEFVIRSIGRMSRGNLLSSPKQLVSNGSILLQAFFRAILISSPADCCPNFSFLLNISFVMDLSVIYFSRVEVEAVIFDVSRSQKIF
jgi:hypothetical protein